MIAVDVGCGNRFLKIDGYKVIRVDIRKDVNPDIVADARNLPFEPESIDLIYSSHLLEHIERRDLYKLMKNWWSVLKKEGKLIIIVPDLEVAAIELLSGTTNPYTWDIIYGAQSNNNDFHKSGFTKNSLIAFVEKYGFKVQGAECKDRQIFLKAKKIGEVFYE